MKKMTLFLFAGFLLNQYSNAQFRPLTPPQPVKKNPPKTQASPGLEATPTRPPGSTAPAPATNYYLSDVKVNIGTGNDNKESLSNVAVEFWVRDTRYAVYAQYNLTNELRSNSTIPIGLEKSATYTSGSINAIPISYQAKPSGTQPVKFSDIQAYGIAVRIIYKPNLFTDAWKVQNVSVSFNFRDTQGNLQPGLGTKTITFPNAATFLDCLDKRQLICTADGNLNPLSSFVVKDISRLW